MNYWKRIQRIRLKASLSIISSKKNPFISICYANVAEKLVMDDSIKNKKLTENIHSYARENKMLSTLKRQEITQICTVGIQTKF